MSPPSWATAGRTRVSKKLLDGVDDRLVLGIEGDAGGVVGARPRRRRGRPIRSAP